MEPKSDRNNTRRTSRGAILLGLLPGFLLSASPLAATQSCPQETVMWLHMCDLQVVDCSWISSCDLGSETKEMKAVACAKIDGQEVCHDGGCGFGASTKYSEYCQVMALENPAAIGDNLPVPPKESGPGGFNDPVTSLVFYGGLVFDAASPDEASASGAVGLQIALRPRFALELSYGLGELEVDTGAARQSLDYERLSLGARFSASRRELRPFVQVGLSLYDFETLSSEVGFNAGLGMSRRIGDRTSFELVGTYHTLDPGTLELDFVEIQGGFRFHF